MLSGTKASPYLKRNNVPHTLEYNCTSNKDRIAYNQNPGNQIQARIRQFLSHISESSRRGKELPMVSYQGSYDTKK